ncbi:hypothetical protein BDP27DRAFT_1316135 [Rhodocollybia butyracea]|uniref:Uncharacterized protein n=1 Tax=Rhodocollybia butyracea TaxID=206335 RepID=A0A9P5Q512_9AGAR|nr:hypothetical protein BDP27DRAFT_1316135 [Rhodocollybia butyracea]
MPLTMTTHDNKSQPFLVTVLTTAISSVGYGMSIFAIGIIWLLPSIRPVVPAQVAKPKPKSRRRRSAPPVLQQSRPAIIPITTSSSKSSVDSPPLNRRVYFADSPTIQADPINLRRHTLPTKGDEAFSPLNAISNVLLLDASPPTSSSTLVHNSPPTNLFPIPDANESSGSELSRQSSNASSRPSLSLTPRMPAKIKASWNRGNKPIGTNNATDSGGEATPSDCSASPSIPISRTKHRRHSLGFGWPSSKNQASIEPDTSSVTSSPRSSLTIPDVSSKRDRPCTPTSLFSTTKPQRRVSAPVRERTQPYAFPYFAMPPDMVEDQSRGAISNPAREVRTVNAAADAEPKQEEHVSSASALNSRRETGNLQDSLGLERPRTHRRMTSEGSTLAS